MNENAARILVVDDEANIRSALVKLLTKTGFVARSASGAQEALAAMRSAPVGVILTDLKMQGGDGIQLLKDAKKQDSAIEVK